MNGHLQETRRILLTEIGNRNTGDEVLIASAIRRFVAAGWRVSLLCRVRPRDDVHAGLPVEIHELDVADFFERVASPESLVSEFARRHPAAHDRTQALVARHDLVAIAPGGRFTAGYNIPRALLTASVALDAGVPVVNLHQSIGPLHTEEHRQLVASVFSHSQLNLIRDDSSHDFMLRCGVPAEKLARTRDVAFGESFTAGGDPQYDVGINIRCGFNGRVDLAVLRHYLQQLRHARPSLRILVYSTTHAPGDDVRCAAEDLANVSCDLPHWDACLREPSACRVNITDSFHGMIFSMLANRPAICCQTDYSTWKIQGTRTPGLPDIEVHRGFTSADDNPVLLSRTLQALDHPAPILDAQARRAAHARQLCEEGWHALWAALAGNFVEGALRS